MADEILTNIANEETNVFQEPETNFSENPLFLKLREQSIIQITEMMESTIASMQRLERSMERIASSTSGVVSTARIWSSFYDPMVVEKLKQDNTKIATASEIVTTENE